MRATGSFGDSLSRMRSINSVACLGWENDSHAQSLEHFLCDFFGGRCEWRNHQIWFLVGQSQRRYQDRIPGESLQWRRRRNQGWCETLSTALLGLSWQRG